MTSLIREKQKIFDEYAEHITSERRARMEQVARERTRYITVVLEDVYQPHNISAVLRSCDCFGIQDVHIIEERHTFTVAKDVVKGAAQWLSIKRSRIQETADITRTFDTLRSEGFTIVATTPHKDDMLIDRLPLDKKVALIFGTELQGLSDYALKQADVFVKVPLYGFTESFNISVAAGISLYELTKRLRESSYDWRLTHEQLLDLQLEWLMRTTPYSDQIKKKLEALVKM